MALEAASLDRTEPGAGLSKFAPVALKSLPEKPSVSVLITCFNYGAYVGEAIESALAQTYENFEMIVCDDGSTDNSCEVIEPYARRDPRIRLIRQFWEQSVHRAVSRNAGRRSADRRLTPAQSR